jgi:hypothetical protein
MDGDQVLNYLTVLQPHIQLLDPLDNPQRMTKLLERVFCGLFPRIWTAADDAFSSGDLV